MHTQAADFGGLGRDYTKLRLQHIQWPKHRTRGLALARSLSRLRSTDRSAPSKAQARNFEARAGSRFRAYYADRDCGDFGSHAEAQRFFIANGGPAADPHKLDRDNDGLACESI